MTAPNYDRAAKMAYLSLIDLKIQAFPVEPLDILKKCKNTVIHTYDELMQRYGVTDRLSFKDFEMEGRDAVTIRKETNGHPVYELFYYSHGDPRRRRFTLAHELGHIVLGHKMEAPWEEKEADHFASQLLAPRPVFPILTIHSHNMQNPETVSRLFGLSKAASEVVVSKRNIPDYDEISFNVSSLFMNYVLSISP